jgi:hypothetical protein
VVADVADGVDVVDVVDDSSGLEQVPAMQIDVTSTTEQSLLVLQSWEHKKFPKKSSNE